MRTVSSIVGWCVPSAAATHNHPRPIPTPQPHPTPRHPAKTKATRPPPARSAPAVETGRPALCGSRSGCPPSRSQSGSPRWGPTGSWWRAPGTCTGTRSWRHPRRHGPPAAGPGGEGQRRGVHTECHLAGSRDTITLWLHGLSSDKKHHPCHGPRNHPPALAGAGSPSPVLPAGRRRPPPPPPAPAASRTVASPRAGSLHANHHREGHPRPWHSARCAMARPVFAAPTPQLGSCARDPLAS